MNLAVILTAPGAPRAPSDPTALHADSAAALIETVLAALDQQKLERLLLIDAAQDGPLHPLSPLWLSKLAELRHLFEADGSVLIFRKKTPHPSFGAGGLGGIGGLGGFGGSSFSAPPPSFQTLQLSRIFGVPVELRSE